MKIYVAEIEFNGEVEVHLIEAPSLTAARVYASSIPIVNVSLATQLEMREMADKPIHKANFYKAPKDGEVDGGGGTIQF